MNTLLDKLVQINGSDFKDEKIIEMSRNLTNSEFDRLNEALACIANSHHSSQSVNDTINSLPLDEKIFLLSLIINKANDLLLYPAELRQKQIERWARDMNQDDEFIRTLMIVGPEQIFKVLEK